MIENVPKVKHPEINHTTLRILGLYRSDYRLSLHQREIARKIRVSTNTSHLQLKRLERMRVLLMASKGRHTEYSLNLGNLVTRYYMLLAETFASITFLEENFLIKKVISELNEQLTGTAILFGSFAKGQAREVSDIDLLTLSDREIDPRAVAAVENLIGRAINVKSTTAAHFVEGLQGGAPFIREVVEGHVVLKGIEAFCDLLWEYQAR